MRAYKAYDDCRQEWVDVGEFAEEDEDDAWDAAIEIVGHDDVALYKSVAEWSA